MKTARLWFLQALLFWNAQLVSFASPQTGADQAVRRAHIGDPAAFAHDPKLFLLIGCGLLAIGLVANRRYRS